jgi:hypothetical protein
LLPPLAGVTRAVQRCRLPDPRERGVQPTALCRVAGGVRAPSATNPPPPPSPHARDLPLEGVCVWRSLTLLAWLGGRWEALERANGNNPARPGNVWIMPDPAHCKVRTHGVAASYTGCERVDGGATRGESRVSVSESSQRRDGANGRSSAAESSCRPQPCSTPSSEMMGRGGGTVTGARHAHVRRGVAEAAAGGPHPCGQAEPRRAAAAALDGRFSAGRCAGAAALGERQLLREQHVPRGRERRVREELDAPRRDVAHERRARLRSHDGGAVNALGRGPLRSASHPPAGPTHRDGRWRQSRHAGALGATTLLYTNRTALATHARGGAVMSVCRAGFRWRRESSRAWARAISFASASGFCTR